MTAGVARATLEVQEVSTMSTAPVPRHVPVPRGDGPRPGRLARWAVRVSSVSGASAAVSNATVAIAYAVDGAGAIEDTALGVALSLAAAAGVVGSLLGFVAAIAAKLGHERWSALWVPLCVLPALLAFVVLGEALWWE